MSQKNIYDPLAQWKWDNTSAICFNCGVVQHDQIDAICTTCQRRELHPITKRKGIIEAHNTAIDEAVAATVEKLRKQYNEVFSRGYLYDDVNN